MATANRIKRLMIETLADNINEITLGFDGTYATGDDGAAGRPAVTVTPTVSIIDDSTLLVEATLGTQYSYGEDLKEVAVQFRATDGTFTPVGRYTIRPLAKTNSNEVHIQLLVEVV
jgi:hypothetical protein